MWTPTRAWPQVGPQDRGAQGLGSAPREPQPPSPGSEPPATGLPSWTSPEGRAGRSTRRGRPGQWKGHGVDVGRGTVKVGDAVAPRGAHGHSGGRPRRNHPPRSLPRPCRNHPVRPLPRPDRSPPLTVGVECDSHGRPTPIAGCGRGSSSTRARPTAAPTHGGRTSSEGGCRATPGATWTRRPSARTTAEPRSCRTQTSGSVSPTVTG